MQGESSFVSLSCMQIDKGEILDQDKNLVHWIQEEQVEQVTNCGQRSRIDQRICCLCIGQLIEIMLRLYSVL